MDEAAGRVAQGLGQGGDLGPRFHVCADVPRRAWVLDLSSS